jgi:hypothetical protein
MQARTTKPPPLVVVSSGHNGWGAAAPPRGRHQGDEDDHGESAAGLNDRRPMRGESYARLVGGSDARSAAARPDAARTRLGGFPAGEQDANTAQARSPAGSDPE